MKEIKRPLDLIEIYNDVGVYIDMETAVKLFNDYVDSVVIKSD